MRSLYSVFYILLFWGVYTSCKEEQRFAILSGDNTPPSPPKYLGYKPIVGGARVYYEIPKDKDILSINGEYTNKDGKKYVFSSSYFKDSLDILGFADTEERVVSLYSLDRAGNRSEVLPVLIRASESALEQIHQSIKVIPSFNSFVVSWKNNLQQSVNIYLDMVFQKGTQKRNVTWVLSSKEKEVEETISNVVLEEGEVLSLSVRIGDAYGNITDDINMGNISVMNDMILPKDQWKIPNANDSIAGVPMCFGDAYEARAQNVINGIISRGTVMDIMHTGGRGRTGKQEDGNTPWNFIIDLGDYYELSRIVTNQRHDFNAVPANPHERGYYYQGGNVNKYNMYFLNEDTGEWEYISQHTIEVPVGISDLEFAKRGAEGDMALMYPDSPTFTKPTRWFRYEALTAFSGTPNVLSEITLYGRKANR